MADSVKYSFEPVDHDPFGGNGPANQDSALQGYLSDLDQEALAQKQMTHQAPLPDPLHDPSVPAAAKLAFGIPMGLAGQLLDIPRQALGLGQELADPSARAISDSGELAGHITADQAGQSLGLAGLLVGGGMPKAEPGALGVGGGKGAWSPKALNELNAYLGNVKDPAAAADINSIIAAGPGAKIKPETAVGKNALLDANSWHAYEANPPPKKFDPLAALASPAPPQWSLSALSHISDSVDSATAMGNHDFANKLAKIGVDGPKFDPDGYADDPTEYGISAGDKHYVGIGNILSKAHGLHAKDVDAGYDPYNAPDAATAPSQAAKLASAVKPLDWQSYQPPRGAYPLDAPKPNLDKLGFNPKVPLFKGMTYRGLSDGSDLGFADPAGKPSEQAIFFADNPKVADRYAGPDGYHVPPTYAAPIKPFEVHWPDINSSGSYDGATMRDLINHVKGQGGDAIVIHNIGDLGGKQTQYAFMDPTLLRARHAAFDPSQLGVSNDLLSARGLSVPDQQRRRSVLVQPVDHDPFGASDDKK